MRQIDWEQPLSEDDRAWCVQAGSPTIAALVAANDERFAGGVAEQETEGDEPPASAPATGGGDPDDDDGDDYDDWSVADLRAELEARSVDFNPKTPKNGLISILRKNDAEAEEVEAE